MAATINPAGDRDRFDRAAWFLATGLVALSFCLHWKWCGSIMHLGDSTFVDMLHAHQSQYPFSIRPFTSISIAYLTEYLSISVKTAYFVLQFGLTFVLALTFFKYLRILKFTMKSALLGQCLLMTSLPIMAAHIEPMHTWDDMWAHLFVVISLISVARNRYAAGAIFFGLACLAREQSLILLPVILFAVYYFSPATDRRRAFLFLLSVTAIYLIYYIVTREAHSVSPLTRLGFNFETSLRTRDTIFSLFMSFGFIWLCGITFILRRAQSDLERWLKGSALLVVPVTTAMILSLAVARETRLFFPPFVVMIPMALLELQRIYSSLRPRATGKYLVVGAIVGIGLTVIGYNLGYAIFPGFEFRQCANFHKQWAGLNIGAILILISGYVVRRFVADDSDNRMK